MSVVSKKPTRGLVNADPELLYITTLRTLNDRNLRSPRSLLRYTGSTLPPSLALGSYTYEVLVLHTTDLKSAISGIEVPPYNSQISPMACTYHLVGVFLKQQWFKLGVNTQDTWWRGLSYAIMPCKYLRARNRQPTNSLQKERLSFPVCSLSHYHIYTSQKGRAF